MPLQAYYPLNEQSGSTAYDKSGNGNDGTVNGGSLGGSGVLGEGAYSATGDGGHIELPTEFSNDSVSATAWVNLASVDTDCTFIYFHGNNPFYYNVGGGTNGLRFYNGNDYGYSWEPNVGEWYFVCLTGSPSGMNLYLDGEEVFSTSDPLSFRDGGSEGPYISRQGTSSLNGSISEVRVYDHALTQSEINYLYQTATSTSQLMTGVKSASTQITPDLQELSYSLNGGSIELHVFGSPGTESQEVRSATLDGGTSYTLGWNSEHQDFRVLIEKESADVTTTPTVSSISLGGLTVPTAPSNLTEVQI